MTWNYSFLQNFPLGEKLKRFAPIFISLFLIFLFFLLLKTCTYAGVVKQNYMIGLDSRWEKLNLLGKERNLTAFNNDLLSAIATKSEINMRLYVGDQNELIQQLNEGEIQGILTDSTPDFSNQDQFLFSVPYFMTGPVLTISSSATNQAKNEKAKKIIGVQANASINALLESDSSLQLHFYHSILQAFLDLDNHQIDGVIFPVLPSYVFVQAFYPNRLKIVTTPLTDDGVRLMVLKNKKGEELIEKFNSGLFQIQNDETYDKLLKRWSLINGEKLENN